MPEPLTLNVILINYNDKEYYLSAMHAKQLFEVATVSRADENPENGFQRTLGKTRANSIKKYLEDGNIIPGAIILSAQKKADLIYDEAKSTVTLNNIPSSLLVIDGQHRLYGANMADLDVLLPVCIFKNLEKEQEVQYFIDVNGYQKGVPKTLRLELLKFISEPASKDAIRKELFDYLENTIESPLNGKMARIKSVSGKISHVAFKSAIDPILDLPPMNNLTQKDRNKLLLFYLQAVENTLIKISGTSEKLSNTAFFQAILGMFVDVCNLSLTNYRNYKIESFECILEPLLDFDWEVRRGTNQQAIKELTDDIKSAIFLNHKASEDIF